jgi:3-hydroxyacyl-CoA dehydrogenase/enoyl-CoA hydratase/3-hydroxybutyryl-CoA epimerase
MKYFKVGIDADGIALIEWDMPGRSMNVIDFAVLEEIEHIVERLKTDTDIRGAVLNSMSRRCER